MRKRGCSVRAALCRSGAKQLQALQFAGRRAHPLASCLARYRTSTVTRRSRGPSSSTSITACQVSSSSLPSFTGIASPGPISDALVCAAALLSMRSWRQMPSGISFARASRMSSQMFGSSFSLIVMAAVV